MICKYCKQVMINNESDKTNESYLCNCGATYNAYYHLIYASQRKNARAIGRVKTSESWFNPTTKKLETEKKNERQMFCL